MKPGDGGGDGAPLLAAGRFEYAHRPTRDRGWSVAYLLFLALTVAGGVYGWGYQRSDEYVKAAEPGYLADDKHCPVGRSDGGARRRLLQGDGAEFNLGEFFHTAGWWVLASAAASLLLGLLVLRAFRHAPGLTIRLAVAVQVALPLAAGAGLTARFGLAAGGLFFAMAAVAALCFYVWRDYFALAGRLLSVAAEGLDANKGLLWLVLAGQVALLAVELPLALLAAVAYTNGGVEPNPLRRGEPAQSPGTCLDDATGQEVTCCIWQPDAWVGPWLALALLTALWTVQLAFTMRLYVISGTIAQWYFAAVSLVDTARGAMGRSLRHAFGPSFGTLCFGSAVLTWVEMMRSAADSSRSNHDSLAAVCLRGIMECLYSLIEYISKFAVVRSAITGEAFVAAGRGAADLLSRNFLKSVGVWWFPPLVLNTTAFVVSLAWGGAAFGAGYAAWQGTPQGLWNAVGLGVAAGVVALVVLLFLCSVLLDCIQAVYLCFALDLDVGAQTRPEVHAVFVCVPGLVMQQPDGGYAYGQPAHPQHHYQQQQQQGGAYYAPPTINRPPHPGAVV